MPTGRTPNLDLALPVQGELSGSWGNEVNNGITDYVDIAIAGTLTLTGDGVVTLANTQGAAAGDNIGNTTAQYAILKIVGPLSATKVITAPSSSKSYIVINTDSTYGVTVKASGQTGVTVAAGTRAAVVFNGTDYVSVSTSAGTGDVVGPASATDGNLAAFDGVTGKLIKQAATVTVAQGGTGASSLTANNVILGNGTSAVQFVAPGTNGNVLTSNGTTWTSTVPNVTLSANNAFTGANTFYNATGQTFGTATSTQDGIVLAGRAGGTTSLRVTLSPGTLTASRSVTFPDAAGEVVVDSASQTLTNKTLSTSTTLGANVTGGDFLLTRVMLQDTGWDYFDSGTTAALNYVNGSCQRWAPSASSSPTLSITNWPPSGNLGELLIEGVNLGAAGTITWPTINWITSSGATTTTFSSNGVTLQSSGTDWFILWTRDGGTTIYGKFVR